MSFAFRLLPLEGHVAFVHGRAAGERIVGIADVFLFVVGEFHVVNDYLSPIAVVTVLVLVLADFEPSVDENAPALAEPLRHKFGGLAEECEIDEVGFLLFTGFGAAVYSNGRASDSHAALRLPDFDIFGQSSE